jgi:hypothetical protein
MTMWYVAAILLYSATPPNQFTAYETRFRPVGYTVKTDCDASATWLQGQPASNALPVNVKRVYVCVPV